GLPQHARHSIVRAIMAGRVAPVDTEGVRLVDTLGGESVDYLAIMREIAQFGDAWAVSESTPARPLDDRRRVFVLAREDIEFARGKVAIVDATTELELDATARRNRE